VPLTRRAKLIDSTEPGEREEPEALPKSPGGGCEVLVMRYADLVEELLRGDATLSR
jgi:hypothetical protein